MSPHGSRWGQRQDVPRLAAVLLAALVTLPALGSAFDNGDVCVSFKYRYTCAIRRSDLRVRCWHHHTGEVREGPLNQQFRTISCKGRELCGVLHDGSLMVTTDLWPAATGMPDDTPTKWDAWRSTRVEASVEYGSLSCDRTTTCYIAGGEYTSVHSAGGQLVCWGDRGAAFFEQRFPDKYIVVAMSESVCLEEGSCSEEDYSTRPLPICAIRASDRQIVCCCGSNKFMSTIPSGRFKDVSVADGHGCGVLEEGGIVCWGDGSGGKLLAPNIPSGVGGGGNDAIYIMDNGQIQSGALVYADDGDAADEESVAADVQFIAVSTSTQLSCGLLWNGVTVCWSFLTDTDLAISNPGCMMEAVASDGYVSCGRLLRSGLVPSSDEKERELAAAAERTHQNTTFFGLSDTGVFCWQSFPESFIGLERPTETWSLDERRVPLDIRPPLDTLAVCMGLPQREATFDKTRVEALAIALVLATALAFSAYRMVILRRFGDFSFGVTVADHTVFWFGFISGLFDVVSQACFFFMDILYISFRALFLEANKPYLTIVLSSAVLLAVSIIFFLYTSWGYSSDEYAKIDLRSPMAIAKRRFLVSGASLLVVDVSQMVIIVVYSATMIEAGLRPSATAMFSALCCCVGPVYMVVKNYFRAKNAPAKPNDAVQQRKGGEDLIFGDLAKKGAGAFAAAGKSQRRGAGKAAKTRFLAHKMFGKQPGGNNSSPGSNRISPATGAHSFRRHQPPGGAVGLARGTPASQSQSAIIAAFANKKTQARIKQLASATTKKKLMATQSQRRQMD